MWETVWEILEHALLDSLQTLPFLFLAYLLIEVLEHHASGKMEKALAGSGKLGVVIGALLGCVPQCGFSAIAANLAKGMDIKTAVKSAKDYITGALSDMLDLGKGSGPLNHMYKFYPNKQ